MHDHSSINEFDTSCFSGNYVTGDITPEYLARLESERSISPGHAATAIAPVSRSFPRADRGRSVSARHTLLELFDAALRAAHGRALVEAALRGQVGDCAIFAVGKAASAMALGAHDALGSKIAQTLVVTKDGHADPDLARLGAVTILETAHPYPDERSLPRAPNSNNGSRASIPACIRYS